MYRVGVRCREAGTSRCVVFLAVTRLRRAGAGGHCLASCRGQEWNLPHAWSSAADRSRGAAPGGLEVNETLGKASTMRKGLGVTAPSPFTRCRRQDLNLHGALPPPGPQPGASALQARWRRAGFTLQVAYLTMRYVRRPLRLHC